MPFHDVKNIVQEVYLEDAFTRSRCRAWLVLSSQKYLQADIIFPGFEVDCRMMIRALSSEFCELFFSYRHKTPTRFT